MKRTLYCFFAYTFFYSFLFGQSKIHSYNKETKVILKSKIALELWQYYSRFHIDSLNIIGLDLLKKHRENLDPFSKAVSYRLLGCYDVRYGEIKRGLKLLDASKSIFLNLGDEKLISEAYNEIGIAYLLLGDYKTASIAFQSALKHGRNSTIIGMSYMAEINLAKSQLKAGEIISAQMYAEHYIRQALVDEKYESVANAYSFLGQIALDKNQEKRARYCFKKQFNYAKICDAPFTATRAINNEAILAFMSSNYDESLVLFQKVLNQRKSQGFHFYTCEAYMNIANYHLQTGDSIKGSLYIDSCITLGEKHNLLLNQIEALELILEYKESVELRNKLAFLISKRNEQFNQNLHKRKSLLFDDKKSENRNNYLIISLILFTGIMTWLYVRD